MKLRMPHNPIGLKHNLKPLITFTQFCKNRNIPFNENEERFYLINQQKHQKNNYRQACIQFFQEIQLNKEEELGRLNFKKQLKEQRDIIKELREKNQAATIEA